MAVDIHPERHQGDGQGVRDLILGIADGLTVCGIHVSGSAIGAGYCSCG